MFLCVTTALHPTQFFVLFPSFIFRVIFQPLIRSSAHFLFLSIFYLSSPSSVLEGPPTLPCHLSYKPFLTHPFLQTLSYTPYLIHLISHTSPSIIISYHIKVWTAHAIQKSLVKCSLLTFHSSPSRRGMW